MEQKLTCKGCGKYMGVLRDALIRNGMVVYCKPCDDERDDELVDNKRKPGYYPDIFEDIFK